MTSPINTPTQVLPTYYYPVDPASQTDKGGNRTSSRCVRPGTHSTMFMEGRQLLTKKKVEDKCIYPTIGSPTRKRSISPTIVTPPRKRQATKRKRGDEPTSPSTDARKKPGRSHAKTINFYLTELWAQHVTTGKRLVTVDPCAWAGNVIDAPLTRSLFRNTTAKMHEGDNTVLHSCEFLPGTIDYGTRNLHLPDLEYVGLTSVMSRVVRTNTEGRFLFTRQEVAVDHMLFSILLFHPGDHANKTRGRLLESVFAKSDHEEFVCITKLNSKKKDLGGFPHFCLVKVAMDTVYVVIPRENKQFSAFPYKFC